MALKSTIWPSIAVVLSAINFAGFGFAVGAAEPWHATTHMALALLFGWWAWRLRRDSIGGERQVGLDMLEAEVSELRRELSETQERLDFAERLLAQGSESRRVGPER